MKSRTTLLVMTFTLFCFAAPVARGQAPGWSRGQQNLAITYDECLRRMTLALQAEGYRLDNVSGDFAVGIKNIHTAVIICSPAPDAKMFVHIVVASNGDGGGTERQRLQARMDQSAPAAPPAPTPSGGNSGATGPGTLIKWIDYPLTPQRGYDKNGQRTTYTCPPNGTAFTVTGTDIYTDDSSVCTAAVHAGLITFASGGTVTVEVRRPGITLYTGSTRNGVKSIGYDNRPNPSLGAFTFVGRVGNPVSGVNVGGGNFAGEWVYHDGSFADAQVFSPNGTARSKSNSGSTATWAIEGSDLVVRWVNGWSNRYAWSASANQLSGVANGPSGEKHSITLVRQSSGVGGSAPPPSSGNISGGGNSPSGGNPVGRNVGGGTVGGDVFGPKEDNTSFNGTNLTYFARPTVEQCQLDCATNGNCKGYTFIKAGTFHAGDPAMCYLLSAVTGRNVDPGHVSAVKGGGGNPGGGNVAGGAVRGTLIQWSDYPLAAARGHDKSGQRTTFTCPANGRPAPVWGTDFYTDDSTICTAAVHAGLMTFASGGTVTVEIRRPGLPLYKGSSRNGVTSKDYDNGPNPTLGCFVFIR